MPSLTKKSVSKMRNSTTRVQYSLVRDNVISAASERIKIMWPITNIARKVDMVCRIRLRYNGFEDNICRYEDWLISLDKGMKNKIFLEGMRHNDMTDK